MSKMKHLLRKLHIGGGLSDDPPHHRLADDARPVPVPSPNSDPDSISAAMGRFGAVGDGGVDFGFLEEEFQVQLAMAISASDPGAREVREDPESAQIDAAKLMSLGCSGSIADNGALLSLQYWSYNVLNYDEKVMDGFYDVHGVTSNSVTHGKMPLLVDLQAISIVDSVSYDVVFVNRLVDPDLQQLERKVYNVFMECRYSEHGIYSLVQKVADLVVNRMGGPVGDTDEMLKRWSVRISKLRSSLNTIVLPLGRLDVGLSRHRALLFKVLADRINLPCMLVKGSYYTGADDGAVNLIKMDNGSEYIIDLMGAPGALIPAEVPSSHLLNSALEITSFSDVTETSEGSCLVPNKGIGTSVVSSHHNKVSEVGNVLAGPVSSVGISRRENKRNVVEETSINKFENEFGRLIPALHQSGEGSSGISGEASPAENMQVTNVSEYAIRSNFSMPLNTAEREVVSIKRSKGLTVTHAVYEGDSCQSQLQDELDLGKKSAAKLMETPNSGMLTGYNGHTEKINFGEDAEWEIPWEDLHIGERIGIGSYGEVYHADWNGTEVAVKKFLDQDFSGDSLVQFKSEVEIMLRLRHPNVVLFMGAVTRSPHFSILTEFLPGGSLYRLLHRPNHHLDERRRMRMALDVVKGMNHLHTSHPTIVHRDLKSPNLLVDKNWVVKVCDFGLSRTKHHTFLSSKSTAGTPEWMAPEVLRNEPANEKCDVYSFGVILWELATLRIPWKGLNPMQVVGAVGFQHRRLEIPEDVDPAVAQIIRDCWLTEPHLRPSFAQLMHRLRHLQHLVVERTTSSTFME